MAAVTTRRRSNTASSSNSTSSPSMSSSSLSLVASARSAETQQTTAMSLFSVPSPLETPYTSNISSVLLTSNKKNNNDPTSAAPVLAQQPSPTCSSRAKRTIQDDYDTSATLDFLDYLHPGPERPPPYSQVKSSRKITFPVYERPEDSVLPNYTPAVYMTALVLRKVEWLSPYEASPVRGWKNVIMEINSTQLNFYSIDSVPVVGKVKKSKTKKHFDFTPLEHDIILESVRQNPSKFLTPATLVKSYSLQHAKVGLPIDYKKRNSCLRLRCETEQFLIQFSTLEDLIKWANYLSIGINVSLDLEVREMPSDRIVPRRRRNRRNRHRAFSDSELIRRELAEPRQPRRASFAGEHSGLKSKISSLFGRRKSSSVDIQQLTKELLEKASTTTHDTTAINITVPPSSSTTTSSSLFTETPTFSSRSRSVSLSQNSSSSSLTPPTTPNHHRRSVSAITTSPRTRQDSLISTIQPKKYSRRKFLKDSLRCIKLLSNDDSWVGKKVVRSSKAPRFKTANRLQTVKPPNNKFVEECTVGLQGLVPSSALMSA
ncbi:hypothetical protein BON22_1353 [Cyberlindnera fabianii]|uniref:PH domain-containing protein n=1 Tax=Cyberlindnera fabianii TaxID=36022 RepID=A0A1V2LCG9_CYBFA|nr:hypothetical protein BON22_1353 [Cyberlindnera fabianii]